MAADLGRARMTQMVDRAEVRRDRIAAAFDGGNLGTRQFADAVIARLK
jgi:hypothetical protein